MPETGTVEQTPWTPNTEVSGGTRFSAGKAVQCWAPLLGLDLVWDTRDDMYQEWELCPHEETMDGIDAVLRQALGNPLVRDEHGHLQVANAAFLAIDLMHEIATGEQFVRRPTQGLDPVFEVSQMGSKKYAPLDYRRGQSFSTLLSSAYRHCRKAMNDPQARDEESGLLHVAHMTWNLLCLLEFIAQERWELDDITPWQGINTAQKKDAQAIADDLDRGYGGNVLEVLRDYHRGHIALLGQWKVAP